MITLFVMDVDGTMTDGSINISTGGELYKRFDVKDGYGIVSLIKAGVVPIILTGRKSVIVEERARELGISHVYQGVTDKKLFLDAFLKENGLEWGNVAYVGDDVNDLACIQAASRSACPADAIPEVLAAAGHICSAAGGKGAVREFADLVLKERTT